MLIAIVGRPNVGKSTLFNAILGDERAIVKDTPGVTRDRLYGDGTWLDKTFTLIDTGGLEPETKELIPTEMRHQVEIAMEDADVILFVTDIKQGITADDEKIATILRKTKKPVVLCVNKTDDFKRQSMDVYEFFNLGMGEPVPVSGISKKGIGDLLERIFEVAPKDSEIKEDSDIPKIAIIGKPNVGKSSLLNFLAGTNRSIVSDIAGTTRDSVDTEVTYQDRRYIFIDTAGIRKKNKIREELEQFSIVRAVRAIEKADVVMLLIDASEGVTEQDAKILGLASDRGKGALILVNKWDLVEKDDKTIYRFTEKIRSTLSFMPYVQLLFISVKTGQRVEKIFDMLDTVIANQNLRIPTGVLNEIITEATVIQQPPSDKGKRLKIFYATEVSVKPPTFVLFVNDKELMHFSYQRFLENKIREAFGFAGTPLVFLIREREDTV